jgi:hypothetical protein
MPLRKKFRRLRTKPPEQKTYPRRIIITDRGKTIPIIQYGPDLRKAKTQK